MNLVKIMNLVQKGRNFTFRPKIDTKDKIIFTAGLSAKKYFELDFSVEVVVYNSGTAHVTYKFGQIDYDYDNLVKINNFNAALPFHRAYISEYDEKQHLFVQYSGSGTTNEKDTASAINYAIDEILAEKMLKYLQPIVKKTY